MSISDLKKEYEGQSTWAMVLLSIVTIGFYLPFWLFERYKVFNEIAGQEIISRSYVVWTLIVGTVAEGCVSAGNLLLFDFENEKMAEYFWSMSDILNFAFAIMCIMAAFKIGKVLEDKSGIKLNKILLVIFNLFYIHHSLSKIEGKKK